MKAWDWILWAVLLGSAAFAAYQVYTWLFVDETVGLALAALNVAVAALAGYDLRKRRARAA
jgi:hypothetical protein